MGGRPRLSDELKKQRGTLRKHRVLNDDQSNLKLVVTKLPPSPIFLNTKASEVYNTIGLQICQTIGMINIDLQLLAQYCFYLGMWIELAEDVSRNGTQDEKLDYRGISHKMQRNEVKLLNKTREILGEIEKRIGLDVMARKKLIAGIVSKKENKDEFLA